MLKYGVVERVEGGFWIDPAPFIDHLPAITPHLPTGAVEYITDPEHFNVYGTRCIKDLRLARVELGSSGLVTTFLGSPWKHVENLAISYVGNVKISLEGNTPLDSVLLDEVLLFEDGIEHVIAFVNGRVRILAGDLRARWVTVAQVEKD